MNPDDLAILTAVAEETGARLLTVRQFVDWVLFDKVFELGGVVIGFNLPFDISRIALNHGSAQKTMRGGFSFKLSKNTDWPRVRVKHISAKMAFIRYGSQGKKRTPEGQRKKGLAVPPRRGSFVDVKTLASAILSGGYSLMTLSNDALKVEHPKIDADEHGGPLTPDYIRYGMRDVQATWECYVDLTERLKGYNLTTIEPKTLYTEASLGKAYLKQMGVKPWRQLQPDFPPEMIGKIISTYYGGRAEVNIRREKRQVLYCDFLSMYPTVCTLMGLWRFVIANGVTPKPATAETQALLDRITPGDMMDKASWNNLTTLVQLRPADDILPVRARYSREPTSNIGVNRLSSNRPLWYTLADVIAAKVLSPDGKTPIIEQAIRFDPDGVQTDLQPIDIAGNPDFHVEPATTDFYRRVIDLRQTVKGRAKAAHGLEKSRLTAEQLALKILANATSYGIFIEMRVQDLDKAEMLKGYGVDGEEFPVHTKKYEEPGPFFHPLLATLITGAARLMLALAEHHAKSEGLDWVFCDTDSIAMAKPASMSPEAFIAAARRVCGAFTGLNPYEVADGSILQIEDQNYSKDDKAKAHLETAPPLFCYAVSAKRYALFNEGDDGAPIIRKASAHGLGHLLAPYLDPDKKRRGERFEAIKVDLWQEDLWKRIIIAADHPDQTQGGAAIGLEHDARLRVPVASRYAATTPALLRWFTLYNWGKPYEKKVRPFGFLLSLQAEKMEQIAYRDEAARSWLRKYKRDPAPIAPFDPDPSAAADNAFDRHRRNETIPRDWLISYADALKDYHLQPETKFLGGEVRRASGTLSRRHILVDEVQHIGKESDHWEEHVHTGEGDADIHYGLTPAARTRCSATIKAARKRFSVRRYMDAAHVTDRTITAAIAGRGSNDALVHLAEVGNLLLMGLEKQTAEEIELLEWAFEQSSIEGVYNFAKRIGVDGSNLSKALRSKGRKVSGEVIEKIRGARNRDWEPPSP